ncbi:VOC family protein [Nocardioides sp. NPDC092400]|uniref:VOC family protein n=1 Tax=Nocardioides sp. NPDC092400 TaxID=3155196 RepID=UPI003433755B
MTSTPVTALLAVTIDCSDSARLARFYADLVGGEVTGEYPEYGFAQAVLDGTTVNFQRAEGFTRPQWPGQEHPQQYHLDFRVSDLGRAVAHAESLGATPAPEQPGGEQWHVMLDPDGHPFCLCPPREG